MKALILAAGLGTRLLPYTRITPKPLFTLAGQPLLEVHIRRLREAGCEAVIVNTHHRHAQVEAFLGSRCFGIPVSTRHEPVILGTGGAIRNVKDFMDDRPFLVINADIHTSVDLAAVYAFHLRARPAATLVLTNDPRFNSVSIDRDERVRGFADSAALAPAGALTFTGIQVLEPVIFNYLPPEGFCHSIEAFRTMIAAGRTVRGFIAAPEAWTDLGTPERYRQAARAACARAAWRQAFASEAPGTLVWEQLAGDGSDRRWFRLKGDGGSLVAADHGLRETTAVAEVDAFIHIGRHLHAKGLPVPAIHFADPFAGLVFLEDLGDTSLQSAVLQEACRKRVVELYRRVVDGLVAMSRSAAEGFDPSWTCQTPTYSRALILERECGYFCDAFLNRYAGLGIDGEHLAQEFGLIADGALADAVTGFMHRDLQSRNIMLKEDRFYYIDFQGGRIGPLQYDLASLLIDPYVDLPAAAQEQLLDHAVRRFSALEAVEPGAFRRGYAYCALARNLQMLGAFGFLSSVKGKTAFARYIPAAMRGLDIRIAACGTDRFPNLRRVAAQAREKLGLR